ncbi:5-dehydro-4-deoxyglucarate dehydratase [Streptomonospora wellingtoniae]|uniref:Probable 5-dehydro-4-deoxyglucarate dehydratase n=1 Tax=Streptomonospora wellingtoniae TaxID=3075544 RepID=A0ABU2KZ78_9ACTN|nr:5-dehydro-4-deoxyglucarate dehydratase [Streptomonospora sp. DSM 45055]MDT0304511.1 5-dehydro-4-deoxyglucarate dehydratase [Streptomonospora sp. DSM 45055]
MPPSPAEPAALAASLTGLLGFPVTPFTDTAELDLPRFEEHLDDMLQTGPGALFVACGTGEFASLTPEEHRIVVRTAVARVGGAVPVLAGVGGGTRVAREYLLAAEDEGADGALVLPPYLQVGPQAGLLSHYRELLGATALSLIPYQRATAVLAPETAAELARSERIVALKDGHGDIELLQRIRTVTEGRLPLLNGMPTAETSVRAYRAVGAAAYSSAVLAFAPAVATAFFAACERGDEDVQHELLREFYVPLTDLRNTTPGYAVALVKAGLEIRGRSAGPVRPPLADVSPEHKARLGRIIDRGLAAARSAEAA